MYKRFKLKSSPLRYYLEPRNFLKICYRTLFILFINLHLIRNLMHKKESSLETYMMIGKDKTEGITEPLTLA